jgi:hypothetical protein
MSEYDYSPTTFNDTQNTLGGMRPGGMTHPTLDNREIAAFMAEHLLEAGYVIRYDPPRAQTILAGRRT